MDPHNGTQGNCSSRPHSIDFPRNVMAFPPLMSEFTHSRYAFKMARQALVLLGFEQLSRRVRDP